jgi:hypothetical protein
VLPVSDTDDETFVQPVKPVGTGPGGDFSAARVRTGVDLFPASESIGDRRASVPHALRLTMEYGAAFGLKPVADVAECCAIRNQDLPLPRRSATNSCTRISERRSANSSVVLTPSAPLTWTFHPLTFSTEDKSILLRRFR